MKKTLSVLIVIASLAAFMTACEMEVAEPVAVVSFVKPYISVQPRSYAFYTNAYTTPPVLTVEAEDWNPADGELTYQWYTFDTIVDYVRGNIDEVPGATSNELDLATLTPSLDTQADARNYFYAIVTNTNNAATVGGTTDTVQSEVAVISFNAPGEPAIPVITRRPADATSQFGRTLDPLSVKATVPAAGGSVLSYEWIRVAFDGSGAITADADGIPIGATMTEIVEDADGNEVEQTVNSALFQPSPGDMKIGGNNVYFVKVTHTNAGGDSVTECSVPARLTIGLGLRAAAPIITTQPKPATYFNGDTVAALTVAGASTDSGTISYQWYQNPGTTNSNKGGTPIEGATSASYPPNLNTDPNAYYYAVVTNFNENVTGETTATAVTRPVNVRLVTATTPAAINYTITIGDPDDPDNRFNYVRGYGGMEVAWANFPETFPDETEKQYDPDQLGYNILRIMMPVSNTNIDKAMDDLVNVTKRRPHYYDNVRIVNKHGGYVAAAPWSPPKEWKSNNSINGGGKLREQYYSQYALYLKSFAQHMYNRGAPIYVISIQNEPNYTAGYDGCEWDDTEAANFFATHGGFTEGVKGWGGGRQIPRVLAMNAESANDPEYNLPAINNAVAYNNIDVFARHVYGERRKNLWSSVNWVQKRDGKEVWMTEHNINSANASGYTLDSKWDKIWTFLNDVDLVMRLNNENAFVWWASKRFYSMIGDDQYGTSMGAILPRGWALSHYSKYTIDMTRIGFSMTNSSGATVISGGDVYGTIVNGDKDDMDNTSARITAYVSRDGKEISMVMWTPTLSSGSGGYDLGTIAINMPDDFEIGSATAIRSWKVNANENRFHVPDNVGISANRRIAYVNLPNSEIVSVKFTKK